MQEALQDHDERQVERMHREAEKPTCVSEPLPFKPLDLRDAGAIKLRRSRRRSRKAAAVSFNR